MQGTLFESKLLHIWAENRSISTKTRAKSDKILQKRLELNLGPVTASFATEKFLSSSIQLNDSLSREKGESFGQIRDSEGDAIVALFYSKDE
jgi:hypothetical protein